MTSPQPTYRLIGLILVLGFAGLSAPSSAQPSFGDDSSQWAKDGECDDPRFEGKGSATTLLDVDRGHDATDCRKLFTAGAIALRADDDLGERRRLRRMLGELLASSNEMPLSRRDGFASEAGTASGEP